MNGEVIGDRYRVIRLLGQGGMGAVYEAQHTETGRHVAVKVIQTKGAPAQDGDVARFKREAKVVGALETQHIVQVLDAGTDSRTGAPFMVMECLDGEDLHKLLRRVGTLPPEVAPRIAAQATSAAARSSPLAWISTRTAAGKARA